MAALARGDVVKRVAPFILFAGVVLLIFWKLVFLGHTLYAVSFVEDHLGVKPDVRSHVRVADNVMLLPSHFRAYSDGLKAGELRLWNPELFCGIPVYADPMVCPFYPPNIVLHAFLPAETAFSTGLLLHFFFAGVAMFAALRALGRGAGAATAGGLVWMLCGYNAMWFSTGILSGAAVFVPLAVWGWVRGAERENLAPVLLAAAAMGMVFLGTHLQHALFFFAFLLAWGIVLSRRRPRFAMRAVTLFFLVSMGVGMAAILAGLDTVACGYRRAGEDTTMLYHDPVAVLGQVLGLVFGKVVHPADPAMEYELTSYVGVAAAGLALIGLRNPKARFFAVFAGAVMALVFVGPVAEAFASVPLMNFSPPSRWLSVLGFCLAVLAAFGWDGWEGRVRLAGPVLAMTGVAVAAVFGIFSFDKAETLAGIALAATAAAFAAGGRLRIAAAACLAALLVDLVPFFLEFNAPEDPAVLRTVPDPVQAVRDREPDPWRGMGALGGRDLADWSYGGNVLSLYGVETAAGFEAVVPAHYARFLLEAGGAVSIVGRAFLLSELQSPLLDVINLKYLFAPAGVAVPPHFRKVGQWGRVGVYENPRALPRAWVVGGLQPARDEDASAALLKGAGFDPRNSVIVEGSALAPRPAKPVAHRIDWRERTPGRLRLEVEAGEAGILVLSETDYPGWEATVDGNPADILRANLAFRAVELPAGRHVVEFLFRPEAARTGVPASAAFLLLALGYAWASRRRGIVQA